MHEWKTFDYRETTDNDRITWIFQDFIPVAKLQGDKSYSIISDHLGTPILAVDNEGIKVWERELDIYGKVRKETKENANFVPFRYQGQYYDNEVDLAYNRFRYYSPDTGAYISQDPIGLAGENPTLYGYVFDNNVEVDIFGLDCSTYARTRFNELTNGLPTNKTKQGRKFIRTDIEILLNEYKGFRKNGFEIIKKTPTSKILVNKDTREIVTIRKSDSGGYDKFDTITFKFPKDNKNNSVFFKQ